MYTDCERPPTILHGKTELTVDDEGIVVTAIYTCDVGYQLHGLSRLVCNTDNDEWQGDLPACKLGDYAFRNWLFCFTSNCKLMLSNFENSTFG